MGQKGSYKQHPKEIKDEAVALVREQGYSVPEAAKSLGIAANMLYRWKDQYEQQLKGKTLTEPDPSFCATSMSVLKMTPLISPMSLTTHS